jgi:hypothetical protein
VGSKGKLARAGLSLLFFLGGGLLLPTPVAAQSTAYDHRDSGPALYTHVPTVPATSSDYRTISPDGRLRWFTRATIGPQSLVGGLFSAAIGTAADFPHEYGTHWGGFGDRYGMRLTGISTSNAIEASTGAIWGEDPRYFQTVNQPFPARLRNALDLTFRAYREDGERHPAYARYLAIFGNNFLSNEWRVPSESNWQHAMVRSGEGFGARFISDTFTEFAPSIWRKLRHHEDRYAQGP